MTEGYPAGKDCNQQSNKVAAFLPPRLPGSNNKAAYLETITLATAAAAVAPKAWTYRKLAGSVSVAFDWSDVNDSRLVESKEWQGLGYDTA